MLSGVDKADKGGGGNNEEAESLVATRSDWEETGGLTAGAVEAEGEGEGDATSASSGCHALCALVRMEARSNLQARGEGKSEARFEWSDIFFPAGVHGWGEDGLQGARKERGRTGCKVLGNKG